MLWREKGMLCVICVEFCEDRNLKHTDNKARHDDTKETLLLQNDKLTENTAVTQNY